MQMAKSHNEIPGQGSFEEQFKALSDSDRVPENSSNHEADKDLRLVFVAESSRLDGLRQFYDEGEDVSQLLMFKTESLRNIALWGEHYSNYMTGARRKVVGSEKWTGRRNSRGMFSTVDDEGNTVEMTPQEFYSEERRNKLRQNLGAAHINADSGLRRKIATEYRQTDTSQESDPRGERQGVVARLRNARKDGQMAPLTFLADAKSNHRIANKLAAFADLMDSQPEPQSDQQQAVLLDQALAQPHGSAEAARYVYALGELWASHNRRLHTAWAAALDRYNQEFPQRPIDPKDPTFHVRSIS